LIIKREKTHSLIFYLEVWALHLLTLVKKRLVLNVTHRGKVVETDFLIRFNQGCSANKKGVGTHPKNSHFKTDSN